MAEFKSKDLHVFHLVSSLILIQKYFHIFTFCSGLKLLSLIFQDTVLIKKTQSQKMEY